MDWIAPAVIGIGFWFLYEAWQSHTTGTAPHPVAKIIAAVQGDSSTASTVAPLPSSGSGQPASSTVAFAAPTTGGEAYN